ncbi:hypothetical protein [Pseudonocardia xishanensis]
MSAERRGLVLVMADVDTEHEDDFNAWYDTEHLPERQRCGGILSARRFVSDGGDGPRYLTVYELENTDVLSSEEYQAISPMSEWQQRLMPHLTGVRRHVFREITRDVPESEQRRAVRSTDGTEADDE